MDSHTNHERWPKPCSSAQGAARRLRELDLSKNMVVTYHVTKGGRRINVAKIRAGAKMPWEKARGVTTFSGTTATGAGANAAGTAPGSSATSQKNKPTNDKWWELPEQEITPEVRRELEIIKMRNFLNPKRFYKANDSKRLPSRFMSWWVSSTTA